jgi:hypothetical protein
MSTNGDGKATRSSMTKLPMFGLILAVTIAAVLQFAAAAKVASGAKHVEQLTESRILIENGYEPKVTAEDFDFLLAPGTFGLEHGMLLDFAIAIFEFTLVVLILALNRRRYIWLLTALVFSGFFGYALNRTLAGQSCGCFGVLWEPPRGLTLVLDAAFVVGALLLARVRGICPRVVLVAGGLCLASVGAGYVYAMQTDPSQTDASKPPRVQTPTDGTQPDDAVEPQVDTRSASERLVASDFLADIRDAGPDDPAWYIFVWDPTCTTCAMLQPIVEIEGMQLAEEGSPLLQVRLLFKDDIEAETGIPEFDWDLSPTVLVVQNGAIIAEFGDLDTLMPNAVRDSLLNGEPIGSER